jgi:hypothetical protein
MKFICNIQAIRKQISKSKWYTLNESDYDYYNNNDKKQ